MSSTSVNRRGWGSWKAKPDYRRRAGARTSYCLHGDGHTLVLSSACGWAHTSTVCMGMDMYLVMLFSSKELWPVMDKWIKYRKGHSNIAYTPDVIVASVLRLIGKSAWQHQPYFSRSAFLPQCSGCLWHSKCGVDTYTDRFTSYSVSRMSLWASELTSGQRH
jgi:hypothetical protein